MNRFFSITIMLFLWCATAYAVPFDHEEHLGYIDDHTCAACHQEGAAAIAPKTAVCLDCHDESFVAEVAFPGLKTHGLTWALQHGPAARGTQ